MERAPDAVLVYPVIPDSEAERPADGWTVRIPDAMCQLPPVPGFQDQGTRLERLAEIAGRVCYDSFGSGRTSQAFHKHILEVGHLSIYEHCVFTFEINGWKGWSPEHLFDLMNRPGVWVTGGRWGEHCPYLRITTNLRAALEWDHRRSNVSVESRPDFVDPRSTAVRNAVKWAASQVAPQVCSRDEVDDEWSTWCRDHVLVDCCPENAHELWVTLWLRGSRGFSHELVRHGDFTAISQRSTRYVNEAKSTWCHHPLVLNAFPDIPEMVHMTMISSRLTYEFIYDHCRDHLLGRGVDAGTARKQARGAARGYLGNALETQLIFSASLAQWEHIFRMRCSEHADEEIRLIMNEASQIVRRVAAQVWAEDAFGLPDPNG